MSTLLGLIAITVPWLVAKRASSFAKHAASDIGIHQQASVLENITTQCALLHGRPQQRLSPVRFSVGMVGPVWMDVAALTALIHDRPSE